MTPDRLRRIRERLGYSRKQMADALGLSGKWGWHQVKRWETGKRRPVSSTIRLYRTFEHISFEEPANKEGRSNERADRKRRPEAP